MKKYFLLLAAMLSVVIAGCAESPVSQVKNGTLSFDKSVTVGDAFDGYKYYAKVDWRRIDTPQKRTIVEMRGTFNSEHINSILECAEKVAFKKRPVLVHEIYQFQVNKDKTFEIYTAGYAFWFDGGEEKMLTYAEFQKQTLACTVPKDNPYAVLGTMAAIMAGTAYESNAELIQKRIRHIYQNKPPQLL